MSSVRQVVLALALGAALGTGPALAGPAVAGPSDSGSGSGSAQAGSTAHRSLVALLTGWQEVPGPGDSTAWGVATVRIWPATGRICYTLSARGVDGVINGAHIHVGARGKTGDLVVALQAPVRGWSDGCTTVDEKITDALADNPSGHYVNVHSTLFEKGAVRGQLRGPRR